MKKEIVQQYLNLLNIKACQSKEEFWDELERNHDENILDQLDDAFITHQEGGEDRLYDVKNQNLLLSLNVSNFSADLYQKYFEWFIHHIMHTPERILDLGCDNGIVLCFYAMLFPDSKVIGIDRNPNGLQCAQELAKKLKLTNVTFLKMDYRKILEYFSRNSFDLITSLRSFHEMIGEFSEEPLERDYLLGNVHSLLKDGSSEFITCERLVGMESFAMWKDLLNKAGLKIQESDFIDFHEIGQEQQIPIIVASRQK